MVGVPLLRPGRRPVSPPERTPSWLLALAVSIATLVGLLALALQRPDGVFYQSRSPTSRLSLHPRRSASRGPAAGVSKKSTTPPPLGSTPYQWTNSMLLWQRTAFHFQPQKNWMNDPDGPLYYKGWYHFFYQYNPDAAVWGNITWGHAVSRDLIHWLYLPIAMVPDRWYDINGVWTGSATFLPGDRIAMLYTGSTSESEQVQNLAFPSDPADPLLLNWTKSEANPVIRPPTGIRPKDFRDPTTAWYVAADSAWRVAIGSKNDSDDNAGIALVYVTRDFASYERLPGVLHSVPGTGMWECVDFYPVSTVSDAGLDTSAPPGPGVKHVLKESSDDDRHDWYAIGTYREEDDSWEPDDPEMDVGMGMRYDYGKFYASKTFYDPARERRVLWAWIGETDSERTDLRKGWASVQAIPRTVLFDQKTGSNLLQGPVEEVKSLRLNSQGLIDISVAPGSVVPLNIGNATQLDIIAEFEMDASSWAQTTETDAGYKCATSGGAAGRGALGPFGFLVLADEDFSEQTAVYFYVGRGTDDKLQTFFCQDELRSSLATDVVKRVYGSSVPVLDGERLIVRILVDHSIVESFAQGGRSCITSRVYPTQAIYSAARLFLFNNATTVNVTAKSLKVWQMDSAQIRSYFD